jgi:hypothetical protein
MISEWLRVMLEEIAGKKTDAERGRAEEKARAKEKAAADEKAGSEERVRAEEKPPML